MNDTHLGCGWLSNLGQRCGEPPQDTIVLRDRLIAGEVLVCATHKAEYNRMAAATRVSAKPSERSKHATTL